MRDELELIEKIERYLNGALSPLERKAFEQEINTDASLREKVSLQRDVMRGIDRIATREQVVRAGKRFHRIKNLRWGIGGGTVLIIAATCAFFIMKPHHAALSFTRNSPAYNGFALPELNETGKRAWAAADSLIPAQVFNINASKDTVIETGGGIVMAVPANAFQDESGRAVTGLISLYIKEALDPFSIMSAGLSTRSGDRLLETGGMFFVDARQGRSILKINPSNGIYARVPGDARKPGMQLFSGKRMPDGCIDWINPKPLSHDLVAVDIKELDFYPPEFLPTLRHDGYLNNEKRYTDSVYYSLAALFGEHDETEKDINNDASLPTEEWETDTALGETDGKRVMAKNSGEAPVCGINPAKIQAIRNDRFRNTLLATTEFAQRLRIIHLNHNPALLDLYVNNLGRDLWEIDSMAASLSTGALKKQFLQAAALRDGKVKNGSAAFEKLGEYYDLQTKLLTEAISKTQADIRRREAQRDSEAGEKRNARQLKAVENATKNFQEERNINLNSAYKQLGYERMPASAFLNRYANTVVVANTGWCNVDRYVMESTVARSSLHYTDKETGKKAVIAYNAFSIGIADAKGYDRLLVYLLPDQLSSFMKLNNVDGTFAEKLNELIHYDIVCIGFKGEETFFYQMKNVEAKNYKSVALHALSRAAMGNELNQLRTVAQTVSMRSEIEFAIQDLQAMKYQQERLKWALLMADLKKALFPCMRRPA